MQFSHRLDKIHPSMTLAITSRAQELRDSGVPVLSLSAGEPDFPTPQYIKDAAKKAIDDNFTRYTAVAGIPPLRKAAGEYFRRHYDVRVPEESIIIGTGNKFCIYSFVQTFINPGDEVLIPSPCWVSYPDIVLLAGGKPVLVSSDAETGFKITPEDLEAHVSPQTRLIIFNTPCNPTGAVYTEKELAEIARWAIAKNIYLLSDEVYDQLVYKPAKMASAISWFSANSENVGVVNGLSKSYAMTGWRVGYMAAHPAIIKKMSMLQGHATSNVCSIAQKAALAALDGPDDAVAAMRAAFEKRRNLAMEIINTWKKAHCLAPDGAFYLFVDVHEYYNKNISGSVEFCEHLLNAAHVACVPGLAFGDDRFVRLSFAVSDDTLVKALQRITQALEAL